MACLERRDILGHHPIHRQPRSLNQVGRGAIPDGELPAAEARPARTTKEPTTQADAKAEA